MAQMWYWPFSKLTNIIQCGGCSNRGGNKVLWEHRGKTVLILGNWIRLQGGGVICTKPLKSILKEINPGISLEGAETLVLWPPHAKSWLTGQDSDAGRDWGQEEKGMTEDEMAGWHHWLDGRESEWTPGVDDGQGGLACCDSWGRKESDTIERVNWA